MTRFRPCIDLHDGQVKQIVGGTLTTDPKKLRTNYVSAFPPEHFAALYKDHDLWGGHVIKLGLGNDEAAKRALAAWPGAFHIAGGITEKNAKTWIDAGAEKVIVTSCVFPEGRFSMDNLRAVLFSLGDDRSKLVLDLSCRKKGKTWFVAMNRWQTITEMEITQESIAILEPYCSEFLIHAADVEGLQLGIDEELVVNLAKWCKIPVTYAGGGRGTADLDRVKQLSDGKVDLTIGSALDIFGGSGVTLEECIEWNRINGG